MPSDYMIVESSGTPLLEQVMVFVIKTIGKSTSEITAILSSLPSAAMGGSVAIAEDASAAWMKGLDGTWGKIGSESGGLPAGGTVGQYIKKLSAAYGDAAWENPDSVPTNNSTNLITSGGVDAALSVLGKAMCVLVEGNKSETVAAVGEYVIVRNSSISGRPDGLYTAAKAIPANTVIDSTYLTAVSGGGLNALKNDMAYKGITIKEQLVTAIGSYSGFYAAGYRFFLLHVEGNVYHMRDYMIPVGIDKFGFSAELIGSSTIYVKVEGLWHENGVLDINTLETAIWSGATIKLIGII